MARDLSKMNTSSYSGRGSTSSALSSNGRGSRDPSVTYGSRGGSSSPLSVIGDLVGEITGSASASRATAALQMELLKRQQDFTTTERMSSQEWQDYQRLEQQGWQKEMFDYQQQNGAVMQFQSLVDAGVNPNTAVGAIGSGSVPSASSPSAPQGEVVGAPSPAPYYSAFEGAQSFMSAVAQASKLKSEVDVNNATAGKLNSERDLLVIDKETRPLMNDMAIAEVRGRLDLMEKQGQLNDAQATQIMELLPALVGKSYAEIDKICSEIDTMTAQRSKMFQEIELLKSQIKTEEQRVKTLTAEEYEAYMSGDASKRLSQAQERLLGLQSDMQSLNNEWTKKCNEFGVNPNGDNVSNAVGFYMTNKSKFYELLHGLKDAEEPTGFDPSKPDGLPGVSSTEEAAKELEKRLTPKFDRYSRPTTIRDEMYMPN